jgi:hypothetical protein
MTIDPTDVRSTELPRSFRGWLQLWFSTDTTVGRLPYAVSGVGLMIFKYGVEAAVIWATTGLFYTPWNFVNPSVSRYVKFSDAVPPWLAWAWILWSLPFLWIAVSMSVRRSVDAGRNGLLGTMTLLPVVNLVVMVLLAVLPSKEPLDHRLPRSVMERDASSGLVAIRSALVGLLVGAAYSAAMTLFSVYLAESYGTALFFGTPIVAGAVSGYVLNRSVPCGVLASVAVGALSVGLTLVGLLVFAFEGLICIGMLIPLAMPLGALGGLLGKLMADLVPAPGRNLLLGLVFLPVVAGAEPYFQDRTSAPIFVVTTSIDISARPQVVWDEVIVFPDIMEQPEWFFRLGISCPQGARITGRGVGAIRECIFTTGTFVEPITTWDEPKRLAFDVREQPAPMFELTPYRHIHPPHLDGAFRSTRGEFALVELPDGGTRLVGRTWYTLEIYPHAYWTIWTDWIVHRIHHRVLRHIKTLAENNLGRT